MASYISQLLPLLGKGSDALPQVSSHSESTPTINYIAIFRPDLVPEKLEESQQLIRQILCFTTPGGNEGESQEEQIKQVNLIGLIRGVRSLAETFADKEAFPTVIRSSKTTTVVKELETGCFLACSVSISESVEEKSAHIVAQLASVIDRSHRFFRLQNALFERVVELRSIDGLRAILREFWGDFIENYNHAAFRFPPSLRWPNSLNYNGFLGVVGSGSEKEYRPVYKKSSASLTYAAKDEINEILQKDVAGNVPRAVIVSYFNKFSPKKYGLMHVSTDDPSRKEAISADSLADIYNLLEYHDYHNKLDTRSLTSVRGLFHIPQHVEESINYEADDRQTDTASIADSLSANLSPSSLGISPSAALEMLHPVNLTNNLVILPLNYTMNSVISLGNEANGHINRTADTVSSWLSVPSYMKFDKKQPDTPQMVTESTNSEEEEEEEEEDAGEYVVGLSKDGFIHSKLVYLDTEITGDNGEVSSERREYQLVVFCKASIFISMIFDSSSAELSTVSFFEELSREVLNPAADEITNVLIGGSILANSAGSLPIPLHGALGRNAGEVPNSDPEHDFFFVVFDQKERNIQLSLPWLPIAVVPTAEGDDFSKIAARYQNAIFHLHDQLIEVFLSKPHEGFFQAHSNVNEYLHKFSSNKLNDWMFYYIRYRSKFIVIIKNRNHSKKSIKARPAVPEAIPSSGMLHQFTDSMYDYANLGFLDSLGDDVKGWLEGFRASGGT